jgi:hypothetical protein
MFGCTAQAIDEVLRDKDPRDIAMYATVMLSNAQEVLQGGGRVEWSGPAHYINMIHQHMNIAKYAIDKAVPRSAPSDATPATTVTVMGLCETEQLFLHPNQTYRFVVMPGCPRCADLARYADGPVSPAEPVGNTPVGGADTSPRANGPKSPARYANGQVLPTGAAGPAPAGGADTSPRANGPKSPEARET